MAENLSVYIEDCARNDNVCERHELDVYSSVPSEKLNETPPETIDVTSRVNGEYRVFVPHNGGWQYMFSVPDANGFPVRVSYNHVKGAGAEYAADALYGGKPRQKNILIFAANGNELTQWAGPKRRDFHRVRELSSPAAA